MRLLILTPEFDGAGGGIMTFYRSLCPALAAAGVDVHVIEGSAFHASPTRNLRTSNGATVETLERGRYEDWVARFGDYASMPALRRHLAAAWAIWEQAGAGSDHDVIEASDWGLLFAPAVVDGSRPAVVQCHGSIGQIAMHDPLSGEEALGHFVRMLELQLISHALAVQAYGAANGRFWRESTGRDVAVVPPAYRPIELASAPPLRDCAVVVARVQRWKGPLVLAEALRALGDNAPEVEWVGRDTPWVEHGTSTRAHLTHAFPDVWPRLVTHVDHATIDEVAHKQASALFNVVPSHWDTFNFSAVEAMASGRPTIVSAGAGAADLVRDGGNAIVVPPGDAAALAEAMRRVIDMSEQERARLGAAGRETIRSALDPSRIAARRVDAYRAAANAHHEKRGLAAPGWLREAVSAATGPPSEANAFLDHMPMRELFTHLLGRVARKLQARAGWP
jgi:glycosyltransferase involved in cell wall biosynthesis